MSKSTTIQCPECNAQIDVNDILKHQIEESLSRKFNAKEEDLKKKMADFEAKKERENELFQERLEKEKKEVTKAIEEKVKRELAEESKDQYEAMQKELTEKSEKIKELHKKDAEISRLQREKSEMEDSIKAEQERMFNQKMKIEQERIKKLADESNEFKVKELQLQLDAQKKLTEEMKRKQEQGSMQMQGEVLELAIEEWLANQYPLDTIDEIKKGATGADCLQIVNTREIQNCGTIYYESKRTKSFQPAWIEKFKNDMRDKNVNIGVLVTEVMPIGMDRMGMREGIWICTYDEFKGLSAVLRQSLIQLRIAVGTQENKGDKMEMLYDFLTSNEFKLQIEGIVEGFTQMQDDLKREKNAMKTMWRKREKQIDKVISNTVHMYGSIRGIAGNAVGSVKALELESEPTELLE